MSTWLWLPATGVLAGLLAGLFGIGGGVIVVAVLVMLLPGFGVPADRLMHVALGTSLGAIVFTSASSAWAHHQRRAVIWPAALKLTPGLIIGGIAAGFAAHALSSQMLQRGFGVFLVLIAAKLATGFQPAPHRGLPGTAGLIGGGTVIGFLSGLAGIGGGVLNGPYLHWCGVGLRRSIATAAACGLPIALAGTLGYALSGAGDASLPSRSTGYVFWPAVAGVAATSVFAARAGAALAHRLPVDILRKAFALLLAATGVRLLMS